MGNLPIFAQIRGKGLIIKIVNRLIMTPYEYIMSNHDTMDMFGKYCGIRETKGVKMVIIDICSLLMTFSMTSSIKNNTYYENNII